MSFARFTALALAATLLAACVRPRTTPAVATLPFPVDSSRSEIIADGVVHRYLHSAQGPWAINVLHVDLDRCNRFRAVKGTDTAAGRFRTSELMRRLAEHAPVVAGVNADFFNLSTGAPVNLLVVDGTMLAPPARQPVLAFDSTGRPTIARFELRDGRLWPMHPMEAVGGRPRLIADSVVVPEVESEGQRSFSVGRNPRTAAGIARRGREVILVTVDGRQKPYSDGMSLRELADLLLALGARDAINLDGGGSTTMVVAASDSSGGFRIANRPSDAGGERAVGDALAVVHACSR